MPTFDFRKMLNEILPIAMSFNLVIEKFSNNPFFVKLPRLSFIVANFSILREVKNSLQSLSKHWQDGWGRQGKIVVSCDGITENDDDASTPINQTTPSRAQPPEKKRSWLWVVDDGGSVEINYRWVNLIQLNHHPIH